MNYILLINYFQFEPAEMLKQHFPDGPPHRGQDITEVIENFDIDLSKNK